MALPPSGLDGLDLDVIGPWSEIKLQIVREYAVAYSRILSSRGFYHAYIDAFGGPGVHIARRSGEFVPGSPTNALLVQPPFDQFYFIDLDGDKVGALHNAVGGAPGVHILHGDCNELLVRDVLPSLRWEQYRRGLCLLDPYGLHLHWAITQAIAQTRSVEICLNFAIMDINRNVLRKNPDEIDPVQAQRMTAYWGDDSWRELCYSTDGDLFGFEHKRSNDEVAAAFRRRLQEVAGFGYVPEPMPMRNAQNSIVYYLYFAAHQPLARKIVTDIFARHSAETRRRRYR